MEIIKPGIRIDFMRLKNQAMAVSTLLLLAGLISLVAKGGPRYGVDFSGGTLFQIQFNQDVSVDRMRRAMAGAQMGDSDIQKLGATREFLVRAGLATTRLEEVTPRVREALNKEFAPGSFQIRREETVGPKVGKDLTEKAIMALGYGLLGILVYVSIRFHYTFAFGGIIALIHDIMITIGIFSLTNKEIDLNVIAALLTIAGFSINDTIVIFDRIRENLKKTRKTDLLEIVNLSVNETLGRTIITSSTVIMVLLGLFLFGGQVIHDFSFALLVGTLSGVYSTVFIASPIVLMWPKRFLGKVSWGGR